MNTFRKEQKTEENGLRVEELLTAVESYISAYYDEAAEDTADLATEREFSAWDECICCAEAQAESFRNRREPRNFGMLLANIAMPLEKPAALEQALAQMDESLPEMLIRLINEKELKNSEVYKGALVSKAVFSNIMTRPDYRPKKTTLFALAVSLKLSLEETRQLLERAGYALSHSFKLDVAMEYFIRNGKYNVFEINEVLLALDLPLLGEKSA